MQKFLIKLIGIIGLTLLTNCALYQARLDLINGWPCKNYNGFNTPADTCRSTYVRTDTHMY
jgi:hypothetical protein